MKVLSVGRGFDERPPRDHRSSVAFLYQKILYPVIPLYTRLHSRSETPKAIPVFTHIFSPLQPYQMHAIYFAINRILHTPLRSPYIIKHQSIFKLLPNKTCPSHPSKSKKRKPVTNRNSK